MQPLSTVHADLDSSQVKLNGRVRRKRSHREKKGVSKQQHATPPRSLHQESRLDDSTDGVASILQRQLHVADQDKTRTGNLNPERANSELRRQLRVEEQDERIIVNQGAEFSPGGAHSSGVMTECEEDPAQAHAGTSESAETAG